MFIIILQQQLFIDFQMTAWSLQIGIVHIHNNYLW